MDTLSSVRPAAHDEGGNAIAPDISMLIVRSDPDTIDRIAETILDICGLNGTSNIPQ